MQPSALTAGRTSAEWLRLCADETIPAGPVNNLAQVFASPQVAARGMRIRLDHPTVRGGIVEVIGNPLHLSETPVSYAKAPPMLGEDTLGMLARDLGLDGDTLRDLAAAGVIEGRQDR